MDGAEIDEIRRKTIALESAAGSGEMAGVEFGPADRPYDVIFLHANGFNAMTYRSILAPLGAEMRILAVDQRGHGRSRLIADPQGRTGWGPFQDDLLALLEALDGPPVVLAGHSMGGCASLLTAGVAPDKIKRMALFDPVIMAKTRSASDIPSGENGLLQGALRRRAVFDSKDAVVSAYAGRGAFRTWSTQMLADYVEDGFRPKADGTVELSCSPLWEAANFAAHDHDPWRGLETFPRPIHIWRAETGSTARIDGDMPTLAARDNIRIKTVPGTSHFLPMERPDLVQAGLREAVLG